MAIIKLFVTSVSTHISLVWEINRSEGNKEGHRAGQRRRSCDVMGWWRISDN